MKKMVIKRFAVMETLFLLRAFWDFGFGFVAIISLLFPREREREMGINQSILPRDFDSHFPNLNIFCFSLTKTQPNPKIKKRWKKFPKELLLSLSPPKKKPKKNHNPIALSPLSPLP